MNAFEWDVSKDVENQRKRGIMTVRFTMREERIRIIGAGYWRNGKELYDKK
jgi:uncharacterized protein